MSHLKLHNHFLGLFLCVIDVEILLYDADKELAL